MQDHTRHPCDLCASDEYQTLSQDPRIAVCSKCGFCYVPWRRSPEEIAAAWDNVFGEGYTSAWPAVKARLTYVVEWIDCNIELAGKSVLDIGAGEGEFLKMVRLKDARPYGVEPCKQNVDEIKRHDIPCHLGSIESFESSEKFDIVTILWTLENCGDCIDFLKRAKSFLKDEGHLVVATGSRLLVPFKKRLRDYLPAADAAADLHCFRFSVNSLGHALHGADLFPYIENRFIDSDWLVIGAIDGKGACYSMPKDSPNAVIDFFNKWEGTWP